MINFCRHKSAMCFAIFFMVIVTAPAVIISIDDTADITFFYGQNEEEEKDNFKLLFEIDLVNSENQTVSNSNDDSDRYRFKNYPKPYKNLISPPPDLT